MLVINSIRRGLIVGLVATLTQPIYGQSDHKNDSINKSRLNTFLIGTGIGYTATLLALDNVWYGDHPKDDFHFFDDSHEWKQMDKIGHVFSAYQLSRTASKGFEWSGLNNRKSAIWGSIMGFGLMLPIELMDGYSSQYGASATDIVADAIGAGVFLSQVLIWDKVKIHVKYSYSPSGIAQYRPELLGKNVGEQWLKDYNGQTYWLSFDLHELVNLKQKWINVGVGYGVNNMVNANGAMTTKFPFEAYRQYYLTLDLDLTYIRSRSKFVNSMLYFVNMIHIPAPALEFNKVDGLKFHALHF